ncbi:MAG TPA: transporter [Gammaproteobacteria bacterium]|nr:transporter [Gammaproteobacteria bacterium]
MQFSLMRTYRVLVLDRPVTTLALIAILITVSGLYIDQFRLDASADSLVLENNENLRYYRSVNQRYGTEDYVIVTYRPYKALFSDEVLTDLIELSNSLKKIDRVTSVVSILDVPLINSPTVSISDLQKNINTLLTPNVDRALARKEFLESPLYKDLILSADGKTTALQVNFRTDKIYETLLKRREALREKRQDQQLSTAEASELARVSEEFRHYSSIVPVRESQDIKAIRTIMDEHRKSAILHLGGIQMITSDMVDFIKHDLFVFGVGVIVFLIVMMAIIFRKLRYILLPLFICLITVIFMLGYLGMTEWSVTVVSSNFISLLLIITLSLNIHLIVRYLELLKLNPEEDQKTLVLETIRTKLVPSFYTAITTIVAFSSLLVSDIRPVIDFGWMMAIGITAGFLFTFTVFPAVLVLLKPKGVSLHCDITGKFTGFFARMVLQRRNFTLYFFIIFTVISIAGVSRLSVENRFIDNFKKSTQIYQGMKVIDQELGGTTPMDIIIDADADFYQALKEDQQLQYEMDFDDDESGEAGLSGTSYWFNMYRLDKISAIHKYLDDLPETGKVLSLDTAMSMLKIVNHGKPLDNYTLSILYKKLPIGIKEALFDPYMSEDGNQLHFSVRIFESDRSLRRNELIKKIRHDLVSKLGLSDQQIHLTGMVVLYNNLLQSLFKSQILTIGAVFVAIMLLFIILFRSLLMATIAIIPNLFAAGMVLGMMGLLNIPLDIMTITIAAITIGIAVDNTIHYIHRFSDEIVKDYDYAATVRRCHNSIGRAMYYTSITVIIGFSILVFSQFMPTIYFGVLTGFAMFVAIIADLALLPLILMIVKPASKHMSSIQPKLQL